jgi:two-component system, chemotaxis family, chemotaxis protein CheY
MGTCLVIDDSSVIRKITRRLLEAQGWDVVEAENGLEGLERCKPKMPDAVFLDWILPTMGAAEFLSALRMKVGGTKPRVIYVVTENDPVDISRMLAAGADDYMFKPFDAATLAEKFNHDVFA